MAEEQCPVETCTEDPRLLAGQPIGQYHCTQCGEMQVAGMEHLHMAEMCEWCIRNGRVTQEQIDARFADVPEGA